MKEKAEVIVSGPSWGIDCFPGCCGATNLYRLEAEYTTQEIAEKLPRTHVRAITRQGLLEYQIKESWNYTKKAPLSCAFGGVLDDMYYDAGHIFFATDNLKGRGDVHKGEFTTRGFIAWLLEHDAIDITLSPLAKGYLQGYSFTFKRRQAYNLLRRERTKFVRWNNKIAEKQNDHLS